MGKTTHIQFRAATNEDCFPLMNLYQKSLHAKLPDIVMLDYAKLSLSFQKKRAEWFVAEQNGSLVAAMSLMREKEHQLCKLTCMYTDPAIAEPEKLWKDFFGYLLNTLAEAGNTDVLYTTTRTLTRKQLEMTLEFGFRICGIFPNVMGADESKLNGVAVYYFKDVLEKKRYTNFKIHPTLSPLFSIVRTQFNLDPLPEKDPPETTEGQFDPLPPLEIIQAQRFVARRFQHLRERKFLAVHFYPFQHPSALITDPDQQIEIFVKLVSEIDFGTIIGERLDSNVSPSDLYHTVSQLFRKNNITYVEVINDAADIQGTDFILKAGFSPCGYFPCLKNNGTIRRDYVVFGKSFEKLYLKKTGVPDIYYEFLDQYLNVDLDHLHY